MHSARIGEHAPVLGQRGVVDRQTPAVPPREPAVDPGRRIAVDQLLGQAIRHGEKEPVEVRGRHRPVDVREHVPSRNDVEHRQRRDAIRRVQRHPMGHPAAPVMPDDHEPVVPQPRHQGHHVQRHHALGVVPVPRAARGLAATAVPAQVGHDDGEVGRQRRGYPVPHHHRLRIPVQQEQRRPGAGPAGVDPDTVEVDRAVVEAIEQVSHDRRSLGVTLFPPDRNLGSQPSARRRPGGPPGSRP